MFVLNHPIESGELESVESLVLAIYILALIAALSGIGYAVGKLFRYWRVKRRIARIHGEAHESKLARKKD